MRIEDVGLEERHVGRAGWGTPPSPGAAAQGEACQRTEERERRRKAAATVATTLGASNFEAKGCWSRAGPSESSIGGVCPASETGFVSERGYGCVYKAKWYGKTVANKEAGSNSKEAPSA